MHLFSHGFRPFFLAAGAYGAGMIAFWGLALTGHTVVPATMSSILWHAHEMLFGFAAAAVAGFFLTATPNWSGRVPVSGWPLFVLSAIWLAGRLVMWLPEFVSPPWRAAVDLAFLPALLIAVFPALAKNLRRQGFFLIVFAVLVTGNAIFHLGTALNVHVDPMTGLVVGLDGFVLLMTAIGGRVVPSFTRSYLRNQGNGVDPQGWPFVERAVLIATAALCVADGIGKPILIGTVALIAGILHAVRLSGWRSLSTLDEPIVWILHVGYLWIPVGLILRGLGGLGITNTFDAGMHALAAGAVGTLTLAVMSRASLGHSGRPLIAGPATVAAYSLVIFGAAVRVATTAADVIPPMLGFALSSLAWASGFALFLFVYLPIFLGPRADGRIR